ncbi:hypothetical protein P171DRAFT_487082 [Karstenula rhodostoma CBS 690.94]|uniref:Uncharacterized protein n=1 Tax=Karstenula rhodostoma CBS 690.94 TaxID=1392251 RepID=A0A9P4PGX0_9PLEO|nr:hypothetical protein P171DRAFT_487082 [Karstenula rhodostoma CBS 690.94]
MASRHTIPEQHAINAVCTLIYQLFLILASAAQRYDISDIEALSDMENSQFWLKLRANSPLELGAAYALPDAPPSIQRAIVMHNFCNYSWLLMRDWLVDLLRIVNPTIRVDVIQVIPKPLLELYVGWQKSFTHTVIRITTTHGRFILDLTAEQFGFENATLLPESKYVKLYTADQKIYREAGAVGEVRLLCAYSSPGNSWWHQARRDLERLEREWKAGLPGDEIRPQDLVSESERGFLRGRLREMVYWGIRDRAACRSPYIAYKEW